MPNESDDSVRGRLVVREVGTGLILSLETEAGESLATDFTWKEAFDFAVRVLYVCKLHEEKLCPYCTAEKAKGGTLQ